MVAFGFVFGFLLGIPVAIVDSWFDQWWLLPILGVVVGWITNALGMWLIFEPPEPRRILGIKVHGLFLRRQNEAAEVYARIIADDVITLENGSATSCSTARAATAPAQMLADRAAPGDRPGRRARCAAPCASRWAAERFDTSATRSPARPSTAPSTPFQDPEFSRRQAEKIRALIAQPHQGAPAARLRRHDARRRSRRTSGCSTPTARSWASPAGSCTWRSSESGGAR